MAALGPQLDPYTTPAGVPPPGVVPNLGPGAPSQQDAILGVCITFIILTTVFVAMRVYVALRITKIPALENWFCVLAMVFSFAYMGILMHLSYASRHMWDVPLVWMFVGDEYWKLRLAQNLMGPVAFFFSRVPVFMLYGRIFSSVRWLRYACLGGIVAAFAIYMHTVPLVGALCYPQKGYSWQDMHTFDRCSLGKPDAVAQGAGNIVLDLYALLLPTPIIWGLKLPTRKRIGLMIVFTTGSFALIASCVSLYYRIKLSYGNDTNWNEGAYDASSAIEINIAIICSCMPAFASLVNAHPTQGSFFTSIRSFFLRSQQSQGSGELSGKDSYKMHIKNGRQSDDGRLVGSSGSSQI